MSNLIKMFKIVILVALSTVAAHHWFGDEYALESSFAAELAEAWEHPVQNDPHEILKGLTYFFSYHGEDQWECQRSIIKPGVIIKATGGVRMKDIPEWCGMADAPEELVGDLADIFAYEIDFLTDIQEGDSFTVYYQKSIQADSAERTGPILAAKIESGGKQHYALYYELPDGYSGYFNWEGKGMERFFLKAPLNYRRISSRFTHRRLHPILKTYRPHLGIDYAAPAGTPVSAIGSGTIKFKGWKTGFGRYVKIKHRQNYESSYGHLSRFEKGIHKGKRVQANDVIGYVGETGIATGPHLDFRVYRYGNPVNFLEMEAPPRRVVPLSVWIDFIRRCEFYRAALQTEQ